jgi:hypothetical protein
MNNQPDDQNVERSETFEPFPKPQTIPAGWDTSELLTAPQPDSVNQADSSAETGDR